MKMIRWRGLRLGRPAAKVWRCARFYGPHNYLSHSSQGFSSLSWSRWSPAVITRKLLAWGRRRLTRRDTDRQPLLREEEEEKPEQSPPTPKGHLVVYVADCGSCIGGEAAPPRRYVVPLVYFNHPLFGELLTESVEEFGYDQPGGITIPCPVSRFERVKDRIAAGAGSPAGRRRFPMKRHGYR